jgi:hypothetical protein
MPAEGVGEVDGTGVVPGVFGEDVGVDADVPVAAKIARQPFVTFMYRESYDQLDPGTQFDAESC